MTNPVIRMFGVGALLLGYFPSGWSQDAPDEDYALASTETVEEIVVFGDKSIIRLRYELHLAEADFFAVFNGLNSTDEYDVKCEYVVDLGSYRRRHLCVPEFADREIRFAIMSAADSDSWDDLRVNSNWVNRKNKKMWDEIASLVSESPALQEAVTDLTRANQAYKAELERREKE